MVVGASVHNRTVQYFADHIGVLITYQDWRNRFIGKDRRFIGKDREKKDRN